MAKAYLSFLGTNDYIPCIYTDGNREVSDIRFVQEATLELCCREWGDEDRILIFTTDEAYKANWLDDGHTAGQGSGADERFWRQSGRGRHTCGKVVSRA
ncbi:TM1812 family CRISPR-associated protein [Desulfonema magnum]|uniref:TM1812 family CRISPR-associated protein n=1 Tax=Desulfonema magnum TaxID=45655 RepID=UPI001A9BC53F|nr:TM1812 family CRISPR-associated protein [Desulfonema magnum]